MVASIAHCELIVFNESWDGMNDLTNERTKERTNERTNERRLRSLIQLFLGSFLRVTPSLTTFSSIPSALFWMLAREKHLLITHCQYLLYSSPSLDLLSLKTFTVSKYYILKNYVQMLPCTAPCRDPMIRDRVHYDWFIWCYQSVPWPCHVTVPRDLL